MGARKRSLKVPVPLPPDTRQRPGCPLVPGSRRLISVRIAFVRLISVRIAGARLASVRLTSVRLVSVAVTRR